MKKETIQNLIQKLTPLLFACIFSFLSNTVHAGVISKPLNNLGLIGYWSFDEGSGSTAADYTGQGNTGTLTNGPTWTTGKFGGSLSFDGVDDYMTSQVAYGGTTWTMSFWYRPDSNQSSIHIMESQINASKPSLEGSTTSFNFYLGNSSSITINTPSVGTWYHIVLIADDVNQIQAAYKDGSLIQSKSYNNSDTLNDGLVWAARIFNGPAERFSNITLDDIRIYNRALTSQEITNLYNQTSSAKRTTISAISNLGLVGYWSFDEGSGSTAADYTGQGSTGTLTNGPTWIAGKVGEAVNLDGTNDYVALTNSDNVKVSLPVTISAWIYRTGPVNSDGGLIFASDSVTDKYAGYSMGIGDGAVSISWGDNVSNGGPNRRTKTASVTLNEGQWYLITGIIRGATDMDIYVDGVDAGGSYSGTGGAMAYSLQSGAIGFYAAWANSYFVGKIDEVRVYNRSLTAQEITTLYNQTAASRKATLQKGQSNKLTNGLVGYWSFNGQDTLFGSGGGSGYTVSGTGNASYDGLYTDTGSTNGGYPIYQSSAGNYLFVDDYYGMWVLQSTFLVGDCPAYDSSWSIGATPSSSDNTWETSCTGDSAPAPTITASGGGGTSTAYDRSGQGNDGTLTNGPAPTIGKVGQALSFDGSNDYTEIPDGSYALTTSDFTWSLWVNPQNFSDGQQIGLLSQGENSDNRQFLTLYGTAGGITVGYAAYNAGSTAVNVYASGTPIPQDEWSLLTVVRSGNGLTIYRDGSVIATASYSTNAKDYSSNFYVGAWYEGSFISGRYFTGKVDEFRIYNRALSVNEIKYLYNLAR